MPPDASGFGFRSRGRVGGGTARRIWLKEKVLKRNCSYWARDAAAPMDKINFRNRRAREMARNRAPSMPGAVAIDRLARRRRRDRLGRHRSTLRELTRQSIDSSAQGQREL